MKSWLVLLTLSSLLAGERLTLAENWFMQSSRKVRRPGSVLSQPGYAPSEWYPVRVPTTVLAALVANNVYPDPYYGLNLKRIPGFKEGRWLVMPEDSPFRPSWWFRTEFQLPDSWRGKYLRLHLDGINYQANVWLNGRKIADAEHVIGMFRRFEFPLGENVRFGAPNALAIEVIPPGLLPNRTYGTKQIQATTGWDDHNPQPPDMNLGLWRDVYVTAGGPVILRHPYVASKLELPSLASAELTISVEVTNLSARELTAQVRGEIEQIRFAQSLRLAPAETPWYALAPTAFRSSACAAPGSGGPILSDRRSSICCGFPRGPAVGSPTAPRCASGSATPKPT